MQSALTTEYPPRAAPLTVQERVRFSQLIRTVETNLNSFLAAGAALAEIKSSKLYREKFETFEEFTRITFGLARSTCDQLIRSQATAELLMANGVDLPPNTTEAIVRPVSNLPSPELQVQAWRLVQAVSPERGPSQPIASKVVRVIKNAIELPGESTGHRPRKREHPSREVAFIAPVRRLSAYQGFDANLVTSHVDKFPAALAAFTAFRVMADRCLSCCSILAERFPELTD
jgi:hypothetical protein